MKKLVTFAIVSFGLVSSAQANLITNGGFETIDNNKVSDWTEFGNTQFSGPSSQFAHAGLWNAKFGPPTPGGIRQTITTTPGETYLVDFWLTNETSLTPNLFAFNWDGGAEELTFTNAVAFAYTQFEFSLLASSEFTTVSFTFQNNPSFWRLDDVNVDVSVDDVSVVSEPASLALVSLGLAGLGAMRRRNSA